MAFRLPVWAFGCLSRHARRRRGKKPTPPPPPPPAVEYDWRGTSVTTVQSQYGTRFSNPITAPCNRALLIAGPETSGNTLHWTVNYNNFTHLRWKGGFADVYRFVEGDLVSVGPYRITGGNFYIPFGAHRPTEFIPGTQFVYTIPPWARPDGDYWFEVRAREADGKVGEAAYVKYQPKTLNAKDVTPDTPRSTGLGYQLGGSLIAPGNLAVTAAPEGDRNALLTWDEVAGASGYIVRLSDVPPQEQAAFTHLTLSGDVLPGDVVFLRHEIEVPTEAMIMNRIWKTHERGFIEGGPLRGKLNANVPFRYRYSGNRLFVDLPANMPETELFGTYYHSRPEEQWYETLKVGDSYRLSMRVATDGPIRVWHRFNFQGSTEPGPVDVQPDDTFQTVEHTKVFEAQRTTPVIGRWSIRIANLSDTPTAVEIVDLMMENLGEPWGQWKKEIDESLTPGVAVRDHCLIKDARNPHSLSDLVAPTRRAKDGSSLHSHLENCARTGTTPWLQVEWYLTAEDYADIAAYLGAPVQSGHPMALLRAQNGQVVPWTGVFDEILYEFGNESWNGIADFWTALSTVDSVTGARVDRAVVFGKLCRMGADAMMASPHWSDKIKWVIGGWSGFSYGVDAGVAFGLPAYIGIANYNGGWDNGTVLLQDTPKDFGILLNTPNARLKAAINDLITRLAPYPDLKPLCYEAGPGYQLNGLNGARVSPQEKIRQEVIMKSVAAATATLETFLLQAAAGFRWSNFFVLNTRGDTWQSHNADGIAFPTWQVCQVLNEEFPGGAKVTPVTGLGRDVWAFRMEGDKNEALVVGNRNISMSFPLARLDLSPYRSIYQHSGVFTDHNRYPVGNRLTPEGTFVPDPSSVEIAIGRKQVQSADLIDIAPGMFKVFTRSA